MFAWLVNQAYFKEMTETDVRSSLYQDQSQVLDDSFTPFGHYDDGSSFIPSDVETPMTMDEFHNLDIHPMPQRNDDWNW
jgi:hypothetical protein